MSDLSLACDGFCPSDRITVPSSSRSIRPLPSLSKRRKESRNSTMRHENHYTDVIMGMIASQITSLTFVYSTVYSGADQRKYQSSASLAFVRGIHRWPVNSPHKWPVTREMFPYDDVIMISFFCIDVWIFSLLLAETSCQTLHSVQLLWHICSLDMHISDRTNCLKTRRQSDGTLISVCFIFKVRNTDICFSIFSVMVVLRHVC